MALTPQPTDIPSPNLTRGTGTLSSGTVTITNAAALTTSMIMVTDTNASITNVGSLQISTKSTGSFVVKSTNVLDTSSFDYVIMNT